MALGKERMKMILNFLGLSSINLDAFIHHNTKPGGQSHIELGEGKLKQPFNIFSFLKYENGCFGEQISN